MSIAKLFLAAVFAIFLVPMDSAAALGPARFAVTADVPGGAVNMGSTGELKVTLTVPAPYHINAARPTFDYLVPTSVRLDAVDGVSAQPPRFPSPKLLATGGMDTPVAVYDGAVVIRVPLRVGSRAIPGHRTIRGTIRYQACDDQSCFAPAEVSFAATFTVVDGSLLFGSEHPANGTERDALAASSRTPDSPASAASTAAAPLAPDVLAAAETSIHPPMPATVPPSLLLMLLFAFLGGLLLNLMPCVLPVLSLKVMSLIRHAHESRARAATLGLAYTAGVVVSFWVLAGVIIALRSAGSAVGWGFQFQEPGFIALLSGIVTAFALSLFGAFEINLPGAAGSRMAEASSREGIPGAFLGGVFATLLATPCTAPFLGTAMGFAFTQPAFVLAAAFTAAALGLALPYLLLVVTPAARRFLPKPGAWMERLKQAFGFLMLATLLWLWFVLGQQAGVSAIIAVAGWNLLAAFALWASFAAAGLDAGATRRILARLILLAVLIGSWFVLVRPVLQAPRTPASTPASTSTTASPSAAIAPATWIPYDAALLEKLRAEGRLVFVDATADWCLTCKVNERTVLETDRIHRLFLDNNVVLMRADWTLQDQAVTDFLASFGRAGVPFYALYPGAAEPITLSEVLTASQVEEAVTRAASSGR